MSVTFVTLEYSNIVIQFNRVNYLMTFFFVKHRQSVKKNYIYCFRTALSCPIFVPFL